MPQDIITINSFISKYKYLWTLFAIPLPAIIKFNYISKHVSLSVVELLNVENKLMIFEDNLWLDTDNLLFGIRSS